MCSALSCVVSRGNEAREACMKKMGQDRRFWIPSRTSTLKDDPKQAQGQRVPGAAAMQREALQQGCVFLIS